MAQKEGHNVISGSVVDANGKALANATVSLNNNGTVSGAKADENGKFTIEYKAGADSIDIECSLVGFETKRKRIKSENDQKVNVTLNEKSVELANVTVDGQTQIMKDDHLVFIPTKNQVNGANSGISLLFNMMIPQLIVDRITGSVEAADKSAVSFYIDGRKALQGEINQLRPKDVVRVEYYDVPGDKFPGEGQNKIVNYIVKKYEYGGYVDMRTDTRWLYSTGDYNIQAKINHKKADFIILAGTNFSKDTGIETTETANYALDEGFTRLTVPEDGRTKNISHYGVFRSSVQLGKTYLNAQAGLNWSESPYNTLLSTVSYSPAVYPSSILYQNVYSKGITPSGQLYFNTKFNKRHSLRGFLFYTYGRNRYKRNYVEGTELMPVLNDSRESSHDFNVKLMYNLSMNHNNSLDVFLWGFYDKSKVDYGGTTESYQEITSSGFQILPSYTQMIANKFRLYVQPGIYIDRYQISEHETVTKLFPRPSFMVSYYMKNGHHVHLKASMGSSEPNMSRYNTTEQYVNSYELMRGNPNLKILKLYDAGLFYNFVPKNFLPSGTFYVTYTGHDDLIKDRYFQEGDKMVHTFLTDGNFHQLLAGLGLSKSLFNRSLQLQTNINYYYQKVNGLYSDDNNYMECRVSAAYFIKGFTFTGKFGTPSTLLTSNSTLYRRRCNYGLTASWGKNGLFVEAGCKNIFDNNPYTRHWGDYGTYSFDRHSVSDSMGKQVYVKLSYNFDFGRKTTRENLSVEKGGSAIMQL